MKENFLQVFLSWTTELCLEETVTWNLFYICRFDIHLYNPNDLMKCVLPYHEDKIFIRVVQLLDLQNDDRWKWLLSLQVGCFVFCFCYAKFFFFFFFIVITLNVIVTICWLVQRKLWHLTIKIEADLAYKMYTCLCCNWVRLTSIFFCWRFRVKPSIYIYFFSLLYLLQTNKLIFGSCLLMLKEKSLTFI